MNIFYLDHEPLKAAKLMVDKHVMSKMLIESCQMLANAFTLEELKQAPRTAKGTYRKHSYLHHGCSKWVISNKTNWSWLLLHAWGIHEERNYRLRTTRSPHFCKKFLVWAFSQNPDLPTEGEVTQPYLAMPEHCIVTKQSGSHKHGQPDPVASYRNYYAKEKQHLKKYTRRPLPKFWSKYEAL